MPPAPVLCCVVLCCVHYAHNTGWRERLLALVHVTQGEERGSRTLCSLAQGKGGRSPPLCNPTRGQRIGAPPLYTPTQGGMTSSRPLCTPNREEGQGACHGALLHGAEGHVSASVSMSTGWTDKVPAPAQPCTRRKDRHRCPMHVT